MGHDLGVGLGQKYRALLGQLLAQHLPIAVAAGVRAVFFALKGMCGNSAAGFAGLLLMGLE